MRGRPEKGITRDRIIKIRVTEEEYNTIKRNAGIHNMSSYIRNRALKTDQDIASDFVYLHGVMSLKRGIGYFEERQT